MTPSQIKKRIVYWQKQMGLGGWELSYSPLPAPEDSLATTSPDVMSRSAVIRFLPNTPNSQYDRLIVHELAHVLLMEMSDLFDRAVGDHQAEAQELLRGQWRRFEEPVCERLAYALTGVERLEFQDDAPDHWKNSETCR